MEALAKKMGIEIIRNKKTRVEGGDYDDKKDRIMLRLKFTNPDLNASVEGLTAEIFVFADPIVGPAAYKMIQRQQFPLSIPKRGTQEHTTSEVEVSWDKTDAKFGERYEGWAVLVSDSTGKIVASKATVPTLLRDPKKLQATQENHYYTRDLDKTNP